MERQTRQLLHLLADDLTEGLVACLAKGEVLETDLRREMPESRQTIGRRLAELETWGIAASEERLTPGRGRPTRAWWLADDAITRFGDAADAFLLDLLERRAAGHRAAIARRSGARLRLAEQTRTSRRR